MLPLLPVSFPRSFCINFLSSSRSLLPPSLHDSPSTRPFSPSPSLPFLLPPLSLTGSPRLDGVTALWKSCVNLHALIPPPEGRPGKLPDTSFFHTHMHTLPEEWSYLVAVLVLLGTATCPSWYHPCVEHLSVHCYMRTYTCPCMPASRPRAQAFLCGHVCLRSTKPGVYVKLARLPHHMMRCVPTLQ